MIRVVQIGSLAEYECAKRAAETMGYHQITATWGELQHDRRQYFWCCDIYYPLNEPNVYFCWEGTPGSSFGSYEEQTLQEFVAGAGINTTTTQEIAVMALKKVTIVRRTLSKDNKVSDKIVHTSEPISNAADNGMLIATAASIAPALKDIPADELFAFIETLPEAK